METTFRDAATMKAAEARVDAAEGGGRQPLDRDGRADPAGRRTQLWRRLLDVDPSVPPAWVWEHLELILPFERTHAFPGVSAIKDIMARPFPTGPAWEEVLTHIQDLARDATAPYGPQGEALDRGTARPPYEVAHVVPDGWDPPLPDGPYGVVRTRTIDALREALVENPEIQAVVVERTDAPADWYEQAHATVDEVRPGLPVVAVVRGPAPDVPRGRVQVSLPAQAARFRTFLAEQYRHRSDAPWLAALTTFREQAVDGWHALPTGSGRCFEPVPRDDQYLDVVGLSTLGIESSGTRGVLDDLSTPQGPLRDAQDRAAATFGSEGDVGHPGTYFVTNGTSTANKIVAQAILDPGDVVVIDRECHKSWHYALVLAGARVRYVGGYPIPAHQKAGGVLVHDVVAAVREVRDGGGRVAAVILTNCTFDGIVSHPLRTMTAVAEVQGSPPPVFVWDEAWFATARASPTLRHRTAMAAAEELERQGGFEPVRVYATQSTHKTLAALRQGSMIHVHDRVVDRTVLHDAYLAHTTTSPSYPVLASLDVARRQVDLYGGFLVARTHAIAHDLRTSLRKLAARDEGRWSVLGPDDLLPPGCWDGHPEKATHAALVEHDEHDLDPTRITLSVAGTGFGGAELRQLLLDRYRIQINLASSTTVLINVHIGTRLDDARLLEQAVSEILGGRSGRRRPQEPLPPAPPFAPRYQGPHDHGGDVRAAYYDARGGVGHDGPVPGTYTKALARIPAVADGGPIPKDAPVSAGFVTPYPPGYPILVPGQVVTASALRFIRKQVADGIVVHGLVDGREMRLLVGPVDRSVRDVEEEGAP